MRAHRRRVAGPRRLQPPRGLGQHVLDHGREHPPQRLVPPAPRLQPGMRRVDFGQRLAHHRQVRDLVEGEEARAQPVLQVVVVVGDVVGECGDLRLQRGALVQLQIHGRGVLADGEGQRVEPRAGRAQQRPVVLHQPLQRLPCQVQPVEARVAALQHRDDPQGLRVVVEAAAPLHQRVQRHLAHMPERRVPEVVGQRHRLGQILVERQVTRRRARDLRDLQRVRQPRAVVVPLVRDEDLRLVLEPPERRRVQDAVAVALVGRAVGALVLRHGPSPAVGGVAGPRREGGAQH